jgi:tetratricopeptide (TPR) repeat protein
VSEPKESGSGDEAQAESHSEAAEASAEASNDEAASSERTEAEGEAEAGEASEPDEGTSAPKKKKKKAREAAEPENIRDRNARVRAEAAEKRRARREREQAGTPRRNLDASEMMDDALARSTHAAASFLTKHFNKVQYIILAGLAGWIAFEVYSWRHARTAEKATDVLFQGLSAEMGRVGTEDGAAADDRGAPTDARRSFASDEERLKKAKSEYLLASGSVGQSTSVLADLGAAGVAYDLGQYKEAQTLYEKVRQHSAFAGDHDIKGRTLEGLGMALEAQKNDDAALKTFRELSNMDVANFSALGLYHQARILKGQGKTEDALKLLDKAGEKLATLKETPGVIKYIGSQVIEMMELLDSKKAKELGDKLMSTEAKKAAESAALTGPGGQKISPELQRRIQEMMDKQRSQPAPLPGPVAPAPEAPQDAPPQDAPPQDAPAPSPSGAP